MLDQIVIDSTLFIASVVVFCNHFTVRLKLFLEEVNLISFGF